MRNLRQRWMLWKHKLPDIVVSLFAVLLLTRYAATKPTNQLQNSAIVNHVIYQLHNGETIKTIDDSSQVIVTTEDIERGYRLASVTTNLTVSYSCPINGDVWKSWTRRGAFCDWFTLKFPSGWEFPLSSNNLDRVTVFSNAKIRPNLRAVSDEISALPSSASAVPNVSEFWHATSTNDSQLLTWRNFRYDRGSGDAVNAQIELFRNGDFVVRSNTVERTFSRIVPFDFDGDGLSNDIDAQPYVYNGDHRGQTAQKREIVLGEVGIGLENGWYYLSAIFPERPHCPTLVSVGTNRLVVVEAGEYLFLLEKGIEYDICVEPKRDDVIYGAYDDVFTAQISQNPLIRSIEWWSPGSGGDITHGFNGEWTQAYGFLELSSPSSWGDGYVAWWPGFKGSPDLDDLDPNKNCVFTGVFTDCHVNLQAQYKWESLFNVLSIVSPNAKTTEVLALPEELESSVLSVSATYGGIEHTSYIGGRDNQNINSAKAGYYVGADSVVFRGGERRPLVVSSHTEDPDITPLPTNGMLTLSFKSGSSNVRLWSAKDGGVEISLPLTWPVNEFDGFTCYIEGNSNSTNIEKTIFCLAYAGYAGDMDDVSEVYICNQPSITAPTVIGVNDDDDNFNCTNDYEEVGLLSGDDDVVPVRVVAQMPANIGGSIMLETIFSDQVMLWRDSNRSMRVEVRDFIAIPDSGIVEETYYVESSDASIGYGAERLTVTASCRGSVAKVNHRMTFVQRIAQPISNERREGVIVNPCGAVLNAETRMMVGVRPSDFPDEKIVWRALEGNVSFVGSNTGREIVFKATGIEDTPIILEVDFEDCPGRRPQFNLTTCKMREISIYPCAITDGINPSKITETYLVSMLDEVNVIYRQVGLSFSLGAPITNVVNRNWSEKGVMNKVYQRNIRNIMKNTGGIEVYFIEGLKQGDELFDIQPLGTATIRGIIVRGMINATTLAHEIGHLCNWKDIYCYGSKFAAENLDVQVSESWLPNDWNNGTGGSFYPSLFSQKNAIQQLLMYGVSSSLRSDISSGNVYGLSIKKTRDINGAILNEEYSMDYIYTGGLPLFRIPITK